MDYKPIRLCDTKGMPEEEWLKMRRHGRDYDNPSSPYYIPVTVGGSDISVITGTNPWRTKLELFVDKRDGKLDNPEAINEAAKIAGHKWEPYVAEMVPELEGFESAVIENDTGFYQHPLYPFAVVNLDRIMYLNGEKCVLEIKTTGWQNFEKVKEWKNGIVPLYYEQQVRWYLATMNLQTAYIVCAWGMRTSDMKIIKIERDIEIERILFKQATDFVHAVETNNPPSMEGVDPELAMASLARTYRSNPALPEVEFNPKKYGNIFKGLEEVLQQKEELKAENSRKMKVLEAREKMFAAKICSVLGRAEKGYTVVDGRKIVVTYKTTNRTSLDSQKIRATRPDIFEEFKKTSSYRTLKLGDEEE